jgi:hypothetical protein
MNVINSWTTLKCTVNIQNYTAFNVKNVDIGLRSVSGARTIIPDPDSDAYYSICYQTGAQSKW